jgi:hypothetical protein
MQTLFFHNSVFSLNISAVIPFKLPLLILGGIDVGLSGQLDNLPPLIKTGCTLN